MLKYGPDFTLYIKKSIQNVLNIRLEIVEFLEENIRKVM